MLIHPPDDCSELKNCSECQANPRCGWCKDDTDTGIGTCHQGGMSGPLSLTSATPHLNQSICPDLANRWFFNDCPSKYFDLKLFKISHIHKYVMTSTYSLELIGECVCFLSACKFQHFFLLLTFLDRSLMIGRRKNSRNPERVSSVFTFVFVCLCNRATKHTL